MMKRTTKRSEKEILDDLKAHRDQLPPGTTVESLIEKAQAAEAGPPWRKGRAQMGTLIDRELWHRAKVQAARERRATGYLMDDAIRAYLEKAGAE